MIDEKKLIEELEYIKSKLKKNVYDWYPVDFSDVISYIKRFPKVGEWIPCSERLPEPYELVLIQNIHGVMSVASRTGEKWFNFQGTELWEAIAWQPLPPKYEGEE